MRELGPDTLKRLTAQTGFPRVTIQAAMERRGAEVRKNHIILSNATTDATRRMTELGVSEADATAFMQPVIDLAADEQAMERQNNGLSIFVDDSSYEAIQLPMPLEERVSVGNRFSVLQLVEPAVMNAEYAVLALSQGGVGLYRCSRFTGEYVELEGLPEDMCYVLRYDQFDKSSGHHHTASARGDSIHHGHGLGKDEHDAFVKRFVEAVKPRVDAWIEKARLPLVLVGTEDVLGLYRKENSYSDTVEEYRHVDPHAISLDELIDLGWQCMKPRLESWRREAIDRFHASEHQAVDVYSVLPALREGRAATLFVDPDRQIPGVFDPDTNEIHVDRAPTQVSENLVDVAVALALQYGVEIVPVTGEFDAPAAILH